MSAIAASTVTIFYLFDLAEQLDLAALRASIGAGAAAARFLPKSGAPPYVLQKKLKTLDDIYRFAVEQVAISRGHLLELTIILILVLELVLFFLGISR
jgi:hypothetical protein